MKSYDVAIIGAGFLGSALAQELIGKYHVKTFDVKPKSPLLEEVDVEHKICDVRNFKELKTHLGKPKVVIHTAIIQIPEINQEKKLAYEVNSVGTQNVCKVISELPETSHLILSGSWHVFGEREYNGIVDAFFGYHPDKVEERAKLYVISKMLQEGIVRFYDAIDEKTTYSIIRLGTILGQYMPKKTAANIFMTNGLQGKPITPYKHTMYRPMLYVAVDDVCRVFRIFVQRIMEGKISKGNLENRVFNLFYPKPVTIIELAEYVREAVKTYTEGKITPDIKVRDQGLPPLYTPDDKRGLRANVNTTLKFFNLKKLMNPKTAIFEITRRRIKTAN